MRKTFCIALILALSSSVVMAGDLTLEAATGLGSPYSPFSSKWNGSVGSNGLLFKEYAVRGGYQVREWLSVSGSIGRLENSNATEKNYVIPDGDNPFPPYDYLHTPPLQKVTYFIPTIALSFETIRLNFGTVIYAESQAGGDYHEFGYPFDGGHRFRPVMGFELGEPNGYLFMRFLDTFPLYSGGIAEAGIGFKVGGIYEQKAYFIGPPSDAVGIGYRGEFRVYRTTAFSIGFSVGGTDTDNVFLMSFGLKTII
jgi:hypothetical protein